MIEEKLYCDEDLSLKGLSDQIYITPHQLSEILNERLGINFSRYINEFRVNEAIVMMKDEPERNLLSIGFAVGFNSKSAFYNACLKKEFAVIAETRDSHPKGLVQGTSDNFLSVKFVSPGNPSGQIVEVLMETVEDNFLFGSACNRS